MNRTWILVPLLMQVCTTLMAYLMLRLRRDAASRAGRVDEARRALFDDAWPQEVLQINNNIRNQFELPVLFYVLSMTLWAVNAVGPAALIMGGLFALSRMVHLYIHIGSNRVVQRRRAFTFGLAMVVLLLVMTVRAVAGALAA